MVLKEENVKVLERGEMGEKTRRVLDFYREEEERSLPRSLPPSLSFLCISCNMRRKSGNRGWWRFKLDGVHMMTGRLIFHVLGNFFQGNLLNCPFSSRIAIGPHALKRNALLNFLKFYSIRIVLTKRLSGPLITSFIRESYVQTKLY